MAAAATAATGGGCGSGSGGGGGGGGGVAVAARRQVKTHHSPTFATGQMEIPRLMPAGSLHTKSLAGGGGDGGMGRWLAMFSSSFKLISRAPARSEKIARKPKSQENLNK